MKRIFVYIILLLLVINANAQTQQGYVKTCGRINAQGEYVPGAGVPNAIVKVKGANEVGSNKHGLFSLKLHSNKFYLEQVLKKGYILVDRDMLSREYTFSPDTFKILLATPEEQLEAELAIERRLNRTLNRQLQQHKDEIEELYTARLILKAERDSALQKLYASHADNKKLIKDMVERYSRIDFDHLDDFNRQISKYILNGKLQKADSMLSSKGDIHSRIEKYRIHKHMNENERAELEEREKTLAKSEELARRELDDLALDCYNKFELFKMQHMNDSAAKYIELRAALDTTNFDWLIDAGIFIQEYLAEYDRSLYYYNLALNYASALHGENHPNVAMSYNNIGRIYDSQGNHSKALAYYTKSLEIRLSIFGENHPDVAMSYNNIGSIYDNQGDYSKALEYYTKSLEILLSIFGENHPDVATSYNNIGSIYNNQGNHSKALEYHTKSLEIRLSIFGENHPNVATNYNNIGFIYYNQGNHSKALEYYTKSLEIYLSIFGENHPNVATSYSNIGLIYYNQGDYSKALEYFEKSYAILEKFLQDDHPAMIKIQEAIKEIKNR